MFYITQNTTNYIIINRTLELSETYNLEFTNKDEFNVIKSFNITPLITNDRYSKFELTILDTDLKEGTYTFKLYHNNTLLYNDICFVNFKNNSINVTDNQEQKIIIT